MHKEEKLIQKITKRAYYAMQSISQQQKQNSHAENGPYYFTASLSFSDPTSIA